MDLGSRLEKFRVWGLGCKFRVQGLEYRFRFQGLGFRIQGL